MHMLAGSMNNDIIDLISDSDDDFDQQPSSASTRFGQNGEGHPISFEDEDWQRSSPALSSSRHIHSNNGQYSGRPTESASHPSSYMAMSQARRLSASSRVDIVGERHNSSTAGVNNSNNREISGSDAQARLIPENRLLGSDERAIYQEALQV